MMVFLTFKPIFCYVIVVVSLIFTDKSSKVQAAPPTLPINPSGTSTSNDQPKSIRVSKEQESNSIDSHNMKEEVVLKLQYPPLKNSCKKESRKQSFSDLQRLKARNPFPVMIKRVLSNEDYDKLELNYNSRLNETIRASHNICMIIECLKLQLKSSKPNVRKICSIIRPHFEELQKFFGRFPELYDLANEVIEVLTEFVRHLKYSNESVLANTTKKIRNEVEEGLLKAKDGENRTLKRKLAICFAEVFVTARETISRKEERKEMLAQLKEAELEFNSKTFEDIQEFLNSFICDFGCVLDSVKNDEVESQLKILRHLKIKYDYWDKIIDLN